MLGISRTSSRALCRKLRNIVVASLLTRPRIVSQTLLVMGATLSPSLSALLPAQPQMNAIINDVVDEVEGYAHLAPSLRLSADILREADNRRRLELTAPIPSSGS
jgi:hypothetical protein